MSAGMAAEEHLKFGVHHTCEVEVVDNDVARFARIVQERDLRDSARGIATERTDQAIDALAFGEKLRDECRHVLPSRDERFGGPSLVRGGLTGGTI
ncbi:hypothetical protein ACFPRL_36120 [Pseudoclavibacter helvolus]